MPLVYVLCTSKKTATYKLMFEKLKEGRPKMNPKQINCDCELAAIKAAKQVFPHSKVQLCYFHIKQSVVRNLTTNHLKERYESDIKFANEVRKMVSVAFLPEDQVAPSWKNFIVNSETLNATEQANDANINYFVNDYFAKNYIGYRKPDGKWVEPRFEIKLWNVHDSTLNGNYFHCYLPSFNYPIKLKLK